MKIEAGECLRKELQELLESGTCEPSSENTLREIIASESIEYRELRRIREIFSQSSSTAKLHSLLKGSKISFPRQDDNQVKVKLSSQCGY